MNSFLFWIVFLAMLLHVLGEETGEYEMESGSGSGSGSEESETEESEMLYFYSILPNSPIVEHNLPAAGLDKPDFIYKPNSGHRIVEFYAHW
jgi:hypothetical protein